MEQGLVLVSACLAGVPCRYDGRARADQSVIEAVAAGQAVAACSEQLGGLPTPRPSAELVGGDGHDVLDGTARVLTADGEDVTASFVAGARAVVQLATRNGISQAILQARSPSCGCGAIYDGGHSGSLVDGDGVTAAALRRAGIRVDTIRGQEPPPAGAEAPSGSAR